MTPLLSAGIRPQPVVFRIFSLILFFFFVVFFSILAKNKPINNKQIKSIERFQLVRIV